MREAGASEFAIWAELTSRMYRAAGHEIPIVGELVTGPRTTVVAYPAGPRERVTELGDGALMDISQRVEGYWSDCTNTHIVGGVAPSAEQLRYARASQEACEAAMAALKPGARASDAWDAAEAAFGRHGLTSAHYAGHQIGAAVNEPPRLVAYDHAPIEVGMALRGRARRLPGPRRQLRCALREDGAGDRAGARVPGPLRRNWLAPSPPPLSRVRERGNTHYHHVVATRRH